MGAGPRGIGLRGGPPPPFPAGNRPPKVRNTGLSGDSLEGPASGSRRRSHGGPSEAPLQPPRLQGGEASRPEPAGVSVRTLPVTCPRRRAAPASPPLRTRTHARSEASQLASPPPLRWARPSLGHAQPPPASAACPALPQVSSSLGAPTPAGGRVAPTPDLRRRARLKLVLPAQFALSALQDLRSG